MMMNPPPSLERALWDTECALAAAAVRARYAAPPLAYVHSFGCLQNVSDGERLAGALEAVGFSLTDAEQSADLILLNTCAVRETAENRVWGRLGALKHLKRQRPGLILAVCGCMFQREEAAARVRAHYPHVDLVFGTHAMHRLPALLTPLLTGSPRVPGPGEETDCAAPEAVPVRRGGGAVGYLPIMRGCDNFCSYCIVPHVRGREVSRAPDRVVDEARAVLAGGCREIMLLGQNVNSYGKGLGEAVDFSALLRRLDALPGDFRLRFMTSHPKDCTRELIDTLAASAHLARHIHLPVQSGSDRVLAAMNRRYTASRYLDIIGYAREKIPGVTFSSDILLGFPGETEEDFADTLRLVERVEFNALFTFIYSKRSGTPAAELPDPTPHGEKAARMRRLLDVQSRISARQNGGLAGQTVRVLAEGRGRASPAALCGRTEHNIMTEFEAPAACIGRFVDVRVDRAGDRAVFGTYLGMSEGGSPSPCP